MNNFNKIKSVVLFKGQSQYDVLRYFVDDIAISLEKLGFNPIVIDLLQSSWIVQLEKVINNTNIEFFFAMNAMGIDLKVGENSIYNLLNAPFFAFMVDHPMYHISRLDSNIENLIVSCVDRDHLQFLTNYMSGSYSKVFIPHGATINSIDTNLPIERRSISILFPGSYNNPDVYRNHWKNVNHNIGKLFDEIMESAYYERDVPLTEVAIRIFKEKGIDNNYLFHNKFWDILIYVDMYLRYKHRFQTLNALSELPIEVYGNGWENVKFRSKNLRLNKSISYDRVQQKMNDSKIVLTINPSFSNGGHERLFSSLNSGALGFVNKNKYLNQLFEHEEDIIFYDFENPLENIINILDDEDKIQKIAERGKKKVVEKHTWFNRTKKIIEVVDYHNFFIT
jgi:Glycosyl transferases group 1